MFVVFVIGVGDIMCVSCSYLKWFNDFLEIFLCVLTSSCKVSNWSVFVRLVWLFLHAFWGGWDMWCKGVRSLDCGHLMMMLFGPQLTVVTLGNGQSVHIVEYEKTYKVSTAFTIRKVSMRAYHMKAAHDNRKLPRKAPWVTFRRKLVTQIFLLTSYSSVLWCFCNLQACQCLLQNRYNFQDYFLSVRWIVVLHSIVCCFRVYLPPVLQAERKTTT